jgi:formylglycine-generating enzyme required for sulfatase activity
MTSDESARFCSACGAKLDPAPRRCAQCGADLDEKARFCAQCGAPAGAATTAEIHINQEIENVTHGGAVVGIAQGGTVMVGVSQVVQNYFSQLTPGAAQQDLPRQQEALQRRIDEYLGWVQARFGIIELRGIEQGGRQMVRLPLDSVYIPLQAVYNEDQPELLGRRGVEGDPDRLALERPESAQREIDLSQVLSLGPRVIITGGPGCGKTTVLQHIAWALAAAHCSQEPVLAQEKLGLGAPLPLPIYAPLNRYAAYLRGLPHGAGGRERALATFISEYLLERQTQLSQDADFLHYLLRQGQDVLLLLDGLDEVPDERGRALVREKIDDLAAGRENLRILVTSRSAAYHGQAVLSQGFRHVRVLPLSEEQIEGIIRLAYRSLYLNSPAQAHAWADDLLQGIRRLEDGRRQRLGDAAPALVDSPLMARLLLIVHANERKLPDQRADLYSRAVDNLLSPEYNSLDQQVKNALETSISGSLAANREMLQHLAFHMQRRGEEQGREIDESALRRFMQENPLYAGYTDALIEQTCQRGTLLEERDGLYRFIHLSFQEFLAARYLVESLCDLDEIAAFLEKGPLLESWWREPTLLSAGYLDMTAPTQARRLLERLARLDEKSPPRSARLEIQLAGAELAATAYLECRNRAQDLSPRLQQRLVALLHDASLPAARPVLRASAADALDALGHLPPDLYRFLPIDPARLPAPPDPTPPAFYLGQHPVTNAQYARFLQAEDFADRALWVDFPRFDEKSRPMKETWGSQGWEWLQDALKSKDNAPDGQVVYPRYWNDPRSGIARKAVPVVGITWYEASAYCRWLGRHWAELEEGRENSGLPRVEARLPTEAEWIVAAGGDRPGERYPWDLPGQVTEDLQEILRRANVWESEIGHTTPVGMYPLGVSRPYGLWDMAGNVWEWQANYADKAHDVLGLRGGAWLNVCDIARLSERHWYRPNLVWDDAVGFRVWACLY